MGEEDTTKKNIQNIKPFIHACVCVSTRPFNMASNFRKRARMICFEMYACYFMLLFPEFT